MKALRNCYGEALVELAAEHEFYVMDADLAAATKTMMFQKAYPDRFFDMGIAEGNLFNEAAGIAACGMPVFASTFSAFSAGRAYDQIRTGIAYSNLHVIIGATHNGISVGEDGATHQCLEDLALMRVVPNMTVICPCDERETKAYVREALLHVEGPVYLRLARGAVPDLFPEGTEFSIGRGNVIRDGSDAVIFTVGEPAHRAVEAAEQLASEGISVAVISLASVKPIDAHLVVEYAKKTGHVFTLEDHSVIGGLGGAVCEVLCDHYPCKVTRIGICDEFGTSGSPAALAELYGIDSASIAQTVRLRLKED